MNRTSRAAGAAGLLVIVAIFAAVMSRQSPAEEMAAAAGRFLDSLSPELRAKAVLAFDRPERVDWHFFPRQRPGVTLGEMTDAQRTAARALLRSALSGQGMLKAEGIMSLDGVLRDMERAAGHDGAGRDPLSYTIAIYGSPGAAKAWGWKIEGHHLSLNYTSPGGGLAAVAPSFMGAYPAEIRDGARAGQRVLAEEEDLGRQLLASLDEAQRAEAIIANEAPDDILTMPGRSLDAATAVGLPYSKMTASQRMLLERLLAEYARNLRYDLAEQELARIHKAGMDEVRFAWAGSAEPGKGHYYRVTGPTVVIEYDNTQNDANHVHTVWHDRERDFGRDLLKEHYERRGHEK